MTLIASFHRPVDLATVPVFIVKPLKRQVLFWIVAPVHCVFLEMEEQMESSE